jgi:DNA-binding transcriptional regulator YdaS (Cro superfamily)
MRKISDRQRDAIRAREYFALDRVKIIVGSIRKLADHFAVSYQAVQGWYTNGVPFQHCAALETLTKGAVQCEELLHDYGQSTARPYQRGADDEILALHRQLAAETLRADQGWQRYESANADRNALRAEIAETTARLEFP